MASGKKRGGKDKFSAKGIDALLAHGLKPEDLPEDLKGKPVHIPQVNFDVPLEKKVQAKYGPPPYATRAKRIEDATEQLIDELGKEHARLADGYQGEPEGFARVWKALVETLELDELNAQIKEHNTYYPMEANLNPDPQTGGFTIGSTPWKPKKKITPERLLEQFPPELDAALKKTEKEQ